MKFSNKDLIKLYTNLVRTRAFDELFTRRLGQGKLLGFYHSSLGGEAPGVGGCSFLRKDDVIFPHHRGHGIPHMIGKGIDIKYFLAEHTGKLTGGCGGMSTFHCFDSDNGLYGYSGLIGSSFPLSAGYGLAAKRNAREQVVVCFFGDGASNNGTFHESLNLASLHKLPVIFVCENNGYGISVSQKKHTPMADIASRAAAYAMPGFVVDGNDVIEVYQSAEIAVKRARAGEGPTLLECKTYRWRGHHEGDPNQGARYRTEEEIAVWKKKCPIVKLEKHLLKNKIATSKKIAAMRADIGKAIDEAVAFANESDFPTLEEMYEDVYAIEGEIK